MNDVIFHFFLQNGHFLGYKRVSTQNSNWILWSAQLLHSGMLEKPTNMPLCRSIAERANVRCNIQVQWDTQILSKIFTEPPAVKIWNKLISRNTPSWVHLWNGLGCILLLILWVGLMTLGQKAINLSHNKFGIGLRSAANRAWMQICHMASRSAITYIHSLYGLP